MKTQTVPVFLPNKGIVLDKPEEFLKESFSVRDSVNFEFDNELLRGRLGLEKFNTGALSGVITLIDQYWKLDNTWQLIIATTKDICKYDFSNNHYDYITPIYNTGNVTIASTGASVAILGSGTAWSANLKAGDYLKVGTGSLNTDALWYEVESVENDSGCTLVSVATTCATADYAARLIFNGASTNFWNSETFQDKALGPVWVGTNGVDNPIYYEGTGQVKNVTGLPSSMTAASYVAVFKDRVIWANLTEGGNETQRLRWSYVANLTGYSASDFHDFVDEETAIKGIKTLGNSLGVFKEEEAYVGRHIGGNYIFDFDKSLTCKGTPSGSSIVKANGYLYYYGHDNSFHKWNILIDEDITSFQTEDIKNFDPNLELYVFGYHVLSKKQIRWHCPKAGATYNDLTIVHDYENGINQQWEYEQTAASC